MQYEHVLVNRYGTSLTPDMPYIAFDARYAQGSLVDVPITMVAGCKGMLHMTCQARAGIM